MFRILRFPSFAHVPWFLPGVVVSVVLGYVGRDRVARFMTVSPTIAWVSVVAVGMILSATLTPLHPGGFDIQPRTSGCDLSRIGPASPYELLKFNDTILNILLFIPLGACLAQVRNRRRMVLLIGGAVALPFLIELTQLVVAPLDRACQSADVSDNVTGLVLGLCIGAVIVAVRSRTSQGTVQG